MENENQERTREQEIERQIELQRLERKRTMELLYDDMVYAARKFFRCNNKASYKLLFELLDRLERLGKLAVDNLDKINESVKLYDDLKSFY